MEWYFENVNNFALLCFSAELNETKMYDEHT